MAVVPAGAADAIGEQIIDQDAVGAEKLDRRRLPEGDRAAESGGRFGKEQKIAANTFLVHELLYDGAAIVWQAETWERGPEKGFQRSPRNARGEPYARRFSVWRPS